uniref:LolP n=1 Tax=Neotyphodium sp. PauTG-1 TaxID=198534 RepID=A7YVF9_9HYPO|nr:LolP [Neotyphodium sp. PauTG-1]
MDLTQFNTAGIVWPTVAAIAISYILQSSFLSWYRLRHIPGPFLASISSLWNVLNIVTGRTSPVLEKLPGRYGPLVRTGPNYVLTDDAEILRHVNGVRSTYPRNGWYEGFRVDEYDHMGSHIDTSVHDAIKSKVIGGYNGKDGIDPVGAIGSQVKTLVSEIRRRHLGQPVDFSRLMRQMALDAITAVAFGEALGFLTAEDGDVFGYVSAVDKMLTYLTLASDLPIVRSFVRSRRMAPAVRCVLAYTGIGRMLNHTRRVVAERYAADDPGKGDLTASFIRKGLTQIECEGESHLQLIAGADTAVTVLRSTLLYIMTTPRVYMRLKAEIKAAVDAGEVVEVITIAQAQRLPYLQAVVLEGFRMRPAVVYGHFKSVPAGGDTLPNGVRLPAGTAIAPNYIALTRRADVYGADVDLFRPERFLDAEPAKRLEMERAMDLNFGLGRWQCAGRNIALMEMNKVFFELLRHFDLQIVYPGKAWDEFTGVVYSQHNMWVQITESS